MPRSVRLGAAAATLMVTVAVSVPTSFLAVTVMRASPAGADGLTVPLMTQVPSLMPSVNPEGNVPAVTRQP